MKIRLLTDAGEWGGTERHVVHLVRTLAARGHDVAVIELGRQVYSAPAIGLDRLVPVINASHQMSVESPRGPRNWRAVPSLLRLCSADVCVLVKGFIDVGTWKLDLLARASGARYVTIEHLMCPMPPKTRSRHLGGLVPGLGLWWLRQRARRGVRGLVPHCVICVSDAVRNDLAEGYGFAPRKLVTVRNGIDVDAFRRDDIARSRVRNGWGASPDSLVFGAVGRLSAMKGYDVAVRQFARLTRERPDLDLRLVLAGDGPQRRSLEQAAADEGVAGRVIFPGHTGAPLEVFSALDVFVMPSVTEGLPLALLEAMACGCPPVAMAAGGIGEVLTDPALGWLVAARDEDGFLDAMRQAARGGRPRLAAMGARARSHVIRHFNADTQFSEVADAIEGIARPAATSLCEST